MPYISTEEVKEIRQEIRKTFPEFKISVRKRHGHAVNVTILSGPIDFETDNANVNQYYIEEHWEDLPKAQAFLLALDNIISRNRRIVSVDGDYGNIPNYYTDISIGSWDKPYEIVNS